MVKNFPIVIPAIRQPGSIDFYVDTDGPRITEFRGDDLKRLFLT